MTNSSQETLWKLVKRMKVQYIDEKCPTASSSSSLHESSVIESQVKSVGKELGINPNTPAKNCLTKNQIELAGEMFLYLIACPKPIQPWLLFYSDLFQNHPPDEIMLNLNRALKIKESTQQNKGLQKVSKEVFNKLLSLLSHFQYKDAELSAPSKTIKEATMHQGEIQYTLGSRLFGKSSNFVTEIKSWA